VKTTTLQDNDFINKMQPLQKLTDLNSLLQTQAAEQFKAPNMSDVIPKPDSCNRLTPALKSTNA